MTNLSEITRENTALRKRISQLSAAILRINASLDVDTVLQEAVDSARVPVSSRVNSPRNRGEALIQPLG